MTWRVLHVINTAEVGGGGEHVIHLARALDRYGFRSYVVVGRDGPATERLRDEGVSVSVMGPLRVSAPIRLARLFRAVRPDLVHLHGSRSGFVGALAAQLSRVGPVVYTAHAFAFKRRLPGVLRWAAAGADRLTCHLARRVICLTQRDVEAARRHGIAANNFVVIPNGIDVAEFASSSDRRSEFGFVPSTPIVGMVARLVPDKDPQTFVRMAREVADVAPETRFLLVGDGPLRPHVERLVRELHLERWVTLTGFRRDVPAILATVDVVVLPSLWEGLPLVVLEAMAAAKPVVATALPSLAEVVVEGVTGLLVPVQEPSGFAEAVVHLIQHPDLRRVMGRQGRERVERDFSLDRMVKATASVYKHVLSTQSNDRPRDG